MRRSPALRAPGRREGARKEGVARFIGKAADDVDFPSKTREDLPDAGIGASGKFDCTRSQRDVVGVMRRLRHAKAGDDPIAPIGGHSSTPINTLSELTRTAAPGTA